MKRPKKLKSDMETWDLDQPMYTTDHQAWQFYAWQF